MAFFLGSLNLLVCKQIQTIEGTPVGRYGKLQLVNGQLCDQNGRPAILRGISSHGLQWYGQFTTREVLAQLMDDWKIDVFRLALYTANAYLPIATGRSETMKERLENSIKAAIELGCYVIIDWHILTDGDPLMQLDEALVFFNEMASRYRGYPNVIYEICNEPNGSRLEYPVTWSGNIKPYAQAIIAAIRKHDPENIIIVGTPNWSQDVDVVSQGPLEGKNIMYALHFYAGSHGRELRQKAEFALKHGLPVFVSECGLSNASGGKGLSVKEFEKWLEFMEKYRLSYVIWNLSDKDESSALLRPGTDPKAVWTENDLSPAGVFIKNLLRKRRSGYLTVTNFMVSS